VAANPAAPDEVGIDRAEGMSGRNNDSEMDLQANARPMITRKPLITERLSWFDRRFGSAWSVGSFRACLGFALIYGWIAYFLGWGLGGSGRLGDVNLLANPDQPARIVGAISAIAFPLIAMAVGRWLGRLERFFKLKLVRWRRRRPKQYRKRLRLPDFERRYRWLLGLVFGTALVAVLIWLRRGDVAAFAIIFSWLALGPVSGIAVARRFTSPTSQGLAAILAGLGSISGAMLLVLAFAGAGVSAFAFAILGVTNVAFAGALGFLLEIALGGALTLGMAIAGAGVATVALALAGAGTGIATLTGVATMSRAGLAASLILMGGAALATQAFEEAAVLSAVIGGVSALAVAAAVSHHQRGRHGAYAGAIGAIALLNLVAVFFGWGAKPLVIFAACFFFLLPLLVGLVLWTTLSATQNLFRGSIVRDGGWLRLFLGWIIAALISALMIGALAFLLGYAAENYNQLALARGGDAAFNTMLLIERAIERPWVEGLWLLLLMLIPTLPFVIITAPLVADGLLTLQPSDYRLRLPLFRMMGLLSAGILLPLGIGQLAAAGDIEIAAILSTLGEQGIVHARMLWEGASPS